VTAGPNRKNAEPLELLVAGEGPLLAADDDADAYEVGAGPVQHLEHAPGCFVPVVGGGFGRL
jgi:hypothetical protein